MGKVTQVPPGTLEPVLTGRGGLFLYRGGGIKAPARAQPPPDEPYDPEWVEWNRRICDAAAESIRKGVESGLYPVQRKRQK